MALSRIQLARRRGVTLLETILAAALLAGLAGSIVAALGGVNSSETRRQARLGGYEVANRLMLQYIDDSSAMPDANAPYEYQPGVFYRYVLTKRPLTVELPKDSVMEATGWAAAEANLKQLQLLDVQVYMSNAQGELIQPIAQLVRCYHPWPLYSSNPDAKRRWFADQNNVATITKAMMEAVGSSTGGARSGSSSGGSSSGTQQPGRGTSGTGR